MRLTLTTAPSAAPIELEEAKRHCRVDHDEDDDLITGLIGTAIQYLDGPSGILGRAVMPQVWLLELGGWPGSIVLPVEPVRSVTVTYVDRDGVTQTLDAEFYDLSAWPSHAVELTFVDGFQRPELASDKYPVRIEINAGYADAASVPSPLKTAMKMLIGLWYEQREAAVVGTITAKLPMAVDALIAPYRRLV